MSTSAEPAYQKRISYQAMLLGGFATLSTVLLLLGNISTSDAISSRKAEDLQSSLQQVVRDDLHDNTLLENRVSLTWHDKSIDVYRGTRDGKVTALAFPVSDFGYGGEINLIMAVDAQGTVLGVRALSHAETPGLGDKMEIEKSNWITGFNGHSLQNTTQKQWAVKKDGGEFDQFTGATISPRAVVRAVKSGLDLFEENRDLLTRLDTGDETHE